MRESALLAQAACGNRQALESLLLMHAPFIQSLSRRFCCPDTLRPELVQAGYTGFLLAVRRYDPSCGTQLLTYAYPWIIGEMKRVLRDSLKHVNQISLDDTEEGIPLSEIMAGKEGIDVQHVDLHLALLSLTREEQLLICLRYYRDKSQAETALLLKKSQAQISRMERKAIDKLLARLS